MNHEQEALASELDYRAKKFAKDAETKLKAKDVQERQNDGKFGSGGGAKTSPAKPKSAPDIPDVMGYMRKGFEDKNVIKPKTWK